jgi:mannose-6-phosphate isomerase class I
MRKMIELEPVFKETIWGGSSLRDRFGYQIPSEHTGEAWTVSAHPQGDCKIIDGMGTGMTLSEFWTKEKAFFGESGERPFPLLIKYIYAKDDLSIQVHPDDAYADKYENGAMGKTECWYILDCEPGADIVIGHHAKDRDEMKRMIDEGRWSEFLNVQKIQPGDFFQIVPGTVHAIRKGTLLIEVQQNSAITYRLYDYDRLSNGMKRELHLDKAKDVILCPGNNETVCPSVTECDGYRETKLIRCPFFAVKKVDVEAKAEIPTDSSYTIVSVLDGNGTIDGCPVKTGTNLILSAGYGAMQVEGKMSLVLATE